VATVENKEEGTKGQVFVVPGVFLTAGDVMVADGYSNKDFLYSLFSESFGSNCAPYGCNSVNYTAGILQNLKMSTARLYTALLILIPVAVAVFGTVIIIRRRNR